MENQKICKTFIVKLVHKYEDFDFLWAASNEYGEYYNKQIDTLHCHFEKMKQDKELKMISKYDFEKMFSQKSLKYKPKFIRQNHVTESCWSIYNSLSSFFSLLKSKGVANCQPPKNHKPKLKFNPLFFIKSKSQPATDTLIIKDKQTLTLKYMKRNVKFKCLYNDKKFDINTLDLSTDGHKLVWSRKDKCFYFHFCLNVNQKSMIKTNKSIYIDLGQKTLATGYIPELNKTLEISSKPLTNKKLTVRIDKCQSKRDNHKLTKYSRRWKFINKAKRRLETKRTNQKKTYLHKASRKLVNMFDTIIVGKLSKNQIDQSLKRTIVTTGTPLKTTIIIKKIIRSKQANRRRNQDWSLALFVSMLSYKAKFSGNHFDQIDESYTTQECCCCKNRQQMKLSDRTYHCKCGLELNRDVNSAVNIYDKYTGGSNPVRNINFLNSVHSTKLFVL